MQKPLNPLAYRITALGNDEAELFIYGDIGDSWFGESVTAKDIADQLATITASKIYVRINSFGGAVSDALAIHNALRRHDATIAVTVDGVAVSAASLIAMAGDTIEMGDNALMMIHAPIGGTRGNAKKMRQMADVLDRFAEAMSASYVRKTGKSEEAIRALLTDGEDHWYTAAEAVEEGFADGIINTEEEEAAASGFDLSRFLGRAPARIAASLRPSFEPTGGHNMGTETNDPKNKGGAQKPANDPTPSNVVDINQARDEGHRAAVAKLKERNAEIKARFAGVIDREGVRDIVDAGIADPEMSLDALSKQVLDKLGESQGPAGDAGHSAVEAGADARDKFAKGAGQALLVRAGIEAALDVGNEFRSFTAMDMARAALDLNNLSVKGMSRMDIVAAAFTTTSDYPNLLADSAHKSMLKGWEEAAESFERFTAVGTLTDFKETKRVDISLFDSLDKIGESGEYKMGTFGDRGETIQLATYGKMFNISRQAIINDDLDAFARIPRRMGRAAKRTIGNLVYAVLTGNVTMSDGVALFHADHGNLATGAAPTTESVDALRVLMALQRDPEKKASALNIVMKHLLVPVALGGVVEKIRTSQTAITAGKNSTEPNIMAGRFDVIEDARLDIASSKAWYGAADQNQHDTIEVAYLDGQQEPYLEQRDAWNVDGAQFKVRIDAGVKALDHKGLAKNPGA